MKKYELVINEKIQVSDRTLYRIRALRDFGDVRKGDLGGYIEDEENLSHEEGVSWVYDNAKVCGNAKVFGNAKVRGNAKVFGNAEVRGNAEVFGNAVIRGDAEVFGNAKIYGYAEISDCAKVFDNAEIFGSAIMYGGTAVYDSAKVGGTIEACNAKIFFRAELLRVLQNWRFGRNFLKYRPPAF